MMSFTTGATRGQVGIGHSFFVAEFVGSWDLGLLLLHRAPPRSLSGYTALHFAAANDHVEMISALAAAGANLEATNLFRRGPWDLCRGFAAARTPPQLPRSDTAAPRSCERPRRGHLAPPGAPRLRGAEGQRRSGRPAGGCCAAGRRQGAMRKFRLYVIDGPRSQAAECYGHQAEYVKGINYISTSEFMTLKNIKVVACLLMRVGAMMAKLECD